MVLMAIMTTDWMRRRLARVAATVFRFPALRPSLRWALRDGPRPD